MAAGGHHHSQSHNGATPNTKLVNGIADMEEDGDNRTRNAKAQRRHREKRKAHLKLLEESVQMLTAQLDDARRAAAYGGRQPPTSSPANKSFVDLQAENAYLREENSDLRRQLYRYAGTYGHVAGDDSKQDGFAPQYPPPQQPLTSPREGSSRDGQIPPPGKPSQYPPPNPPDSGDHFSRGSRSRVMSSSSTSQAPGASPYMTNNNAFPTDPRAHALNQQQPQPMDRYPPLRYESHMYSNNPANHSPTGPPQPPPHSLPRSGMSQSYGVDIYGHRPEGEPGWGPEAGPPPFQGSVYPVTYGDGPAQDEWRHHEEQH